MKNTLLVAIPLAALASSASIASYSTGAVPGQGGVPIDVARRAPGCGNCHSGSQGGNGLQVSLTPTARSLAPAQMISVTTAATGGQPHAQQWGGFVAETTRGRFSAGANSRSDSTGRFVTHIAASQSNGRSWTYGLTAPSQPGAFELFTIVNTVDGNGRNRGDTWGFHGFDATSNTSTPVRLFVNAPGTQAFGSGCVGSFGNWPVLGASQAPTVGNANFALEIVGTAPATSAVVLFGLRRAVPIDLGALGASGCSLLVDSFASLSATTSNGHQQRGEGSANTPFPIPNDPNLRGIAIDTQAAIVDVSTGRRLPITLTNGLSVTIQ